MKFSAKFLLILAFCVVGLRGEQPVVGAEAGRETGTVAGTKVKRKHLKWLRRLCAGEVELAIKFSSIGIPQTSLPEPAAQAALLTPESNR